VSDDVMDDGVLWLRFSAVVVSEGVEEVAGGVVTPVFPPVVDVAVAELPVVAGAVGVSEVVAPGLARDVVADEVGGAVGVSPGVGAEPVDVGLVAGLGWGSAGWTRVGPAGSRSSPMPTPTTARAEPTVLRTILVRRRTRTPSWRRSRWRGSKGTGSCVSRISRANCRSNGSI
jgi:hypothetical protein